MSPVHSRRVNAWSRGSAGERTHKGVRFRQYMMQHTASTSAAMTAVRKNANAVPWIGTCQRAMALVMEMLLKRVASRTGAPPEGSPPKRWSNPESAVCQCSRFRCQPQTSAGSRAKRIEEMTVAAAARHWRRQRREGREVGGARRPPPRAAPEEVGEEGECDVLNVRGESERDPGGGRAARLPRKGEDDRQDHEHVVLPAADQGADLVDG